MSPTIRGNAVDRESQFSSIRKDDHPGFLNIYPVNYEYPITLEASFLTLLNILSLCLMR